MTIFSITFNQSQTWSKVSILIGTQYPRDIYYRSTHMWILAWNSQGSKQGSFPDTLTTPILLQEPVRQTRTQEELANPVWPHQDARTSQRCAPRYVQEYSRGLIYIAFYPVSLHPAGFICPDFKVLVPAGKRELSLEAVKLRPCGPTSQITNWCHTRSQILQPN